MSFSKKVELLLEKKNPKLSSFIFEEKEDDKKDEEESSEAGGLFDMEDEEKESDDDANKESEDEDTAEPESESVDDGDTEESSSDVSRQQIETLTTQIEAIKNTIDKVNKDDGTQSIESFIADAIAKGINETSYSKNSISSFVLTEDKDLEDVEKNIDVLDRVLTKGTDLVDKFKKGKEIDISSYVSAAINAYKNFDNLFAKEKIVKQATINVLVLNSGAKAETNIKEFEELFHEELHRQFGVEYPEYALVTKKHNTAVGAMKQG
mgnify:CR=1 FL=1